MHRIFVLVLASAMCSTTFAAGKPRILVPTLVAERGIEAPLVRLLDELLLTKFLQSGRYDVVGSSDIVDMLEHEKVKQLAGCDTTGCLAEIGGALGVDLVAKANIGRVGDFYLLNIKILDVRTARVVSRWSEHVEGVENALVQALVKSVVAVTKSTEDPTQQPEVKVTSQPEVTDAPQPRQPPAEKQSVPAQAVTTREPRQSESGQGLTPLPFYLAVGGTGALGIGTLVLEILVLGEKGKLENDPSDEGAFNRGTSMQMAEGVLLAATGVAAVASVVLFLFTDFGSGASDTDGSSLALFPAVTPQSVGLTIQGGF